MLLPKTIPEDGIQTLSNVRYGPEPVDSLYAREVIDLAPLVVEEQVALSLPAMPRPVHSARLLRDGGTVEFSAVKGGLVLKLPEPQPEEVDRVIVLELEAAK